MGFPGDRPASAVSCPASFTVAAAVPGAPASPACRARSTSAGSRGAGAAASSDDDDARGPASSAPADALEVPDPGSPAAAS